MTEKYIDLASRISNESGAYHLRDTIIEGVLEWLDEHPDQVPGRTITEGEFDELVDALHQNWATPEYFSGVLSDALIDHGITVIPDPEPTNAEKLVEDLAGIYGANLNWTAKVAISEALTERGWVKAQGGDDD